MLRLVAPLLALAGCGRISFSTTDPDSGLADDGSLADVLLGHDEDGDGVPDSSDVCPHIGGSQVDTDADGVGDDCDPNFGTGLDRIAMFATMVPGDQPFSLLPDSEAVFTPLADAVRLDGPLGADLNLSGALELPYTAGDIRVVVGVDILAIIPGSASDQNQITLSVYDSAAPSTYFAELNQVPGVFDNAQITFTDGVVYTQINSANLANGIHPGPLFMQTTQRSGQGIRFDASWPGEPYSAEVMDALYQGTSLIAMYTNNLHFEIRYLVVITSQ
jgi:Thrombospondin type 3 repeat